MRYLFVFPLLLTFLLGSSSLRAQDFGAEGSASEHLSFKGIPIMGSAANMVQQLRDKGCTYSGANRVETTDGQKARLDMLWGSLVGFDNVLLTVWSTLSSPNYIYQCTAAFPVSGSSGKKWRQIMDIYSKVVEMLGRKYGTPSQVNHYCPGEGLIFISDEEMKYNTLQKGEANWHDTWVTENGKIVVALEYQGEFSPDSNVPASKQYGVVITWLDAKSSDRAKNSELDEL